MQRLRPFTRYTLRLAAVNVRGQSAPSMPSASFETRAAVPESPPEKVYAEPLAADRIQVIWSPLLASHWNAVPAGYVVQYQAVRPRRLGGMQRMTSKDESMMMKSGDVSSDVDQETTDDKWVSVD